MEEDDKLTTDLLEILKELGFTKSVDLWRNPKPIPPPLTNNITQTPEQHESMESSSPQEIVQETDQLTLCVIVEGAKQGTPLD